MKGREVDLWRVPDNKKYKVDLDDETNKKIFTFFQKENIENSGKIVWYLKNNKIEDYTNLVFWRLLMWSVRGSDLETRKQLEIH